MRKTIVWVVIFVVIIGGVWWINQPKPSSTTEPIKIGAILALSGDVAAWGESAKQGIELAVEEFQTKTGKTVELLIENSEGQPVKALSAFEKLIDLDKVDGVVGPLLQAEVAAISPVVSQRSVPVIAPSYAPVMNRPNPRNPLMVWMDATEEAERMAEFVYSTAGVRKIGVLGTRDNWESEVSESFANKFVALGGAVTEKQIVQADVSDVRLEITKILASQPEAIFLGTYYQFVNATKAIRDIGGKVRRQLYSIEVDNYLANETSGYTDGLRFIAPDAYGEDFVKKFETRYGVKPGIPAGQAYDAIVLLLNLFQEHRTVAAVLEAMNELMHYEGASGEIEFTLDHKTFLPTAFFEIKNGQFVRLEE